MNINTIIKKHIVFGLSIFIAGIFSVIISISLGYFGLAVIAFFGLLACSSVLFFLFPYFFKQNFNFTKDSKSKEYNKEDYREGEDDVRYRSSKNTKNKESFKKNHSDISNTKIRKKD